MASYIALCNYTHQGITEIKQAPDRVKTVRKLAVACGADMKEYFLTMGAYDMVYHFEAPSEEVATRFALAVSEMGNVRTSTLRVSPRYLSSG